MTNASLANLKTAHSALQTLYAWDLGEVADMLVQEAFNAVTSVLVEETGPSPFPDLGNTPTQNQPTASGGMSNERRADRILREGRATNRAGGNSGERVVGWVVPTDVAGLSDALFALELIKSRALKSKSAHSPTPRVEEAEAREVIQAACALIASDINVYPNMSRADAVASGYARLNKAVDHYNSAQPACASPSVAP